MKKKQFKPNLPDPEAVNNKTSLVEYRSYSANEDLYNKFIEEERIDHKEISVTKTWNEKDDEAKNEEKDSIERTKKWKKQMKELIRK